MYRTSKVLIGILSLVSTFGMFIATASGANTVSETQAADKSIKQLTFIHGRWTGQSKSGAFVEEYWSAPEGDSMVGYCRFIKDGKTSFYELLAIVKHAEDIVLRMKHLDGEFVAWSDKEEAGDCKLVSSTATEAVFDNGNAQHRVKVTYRKTDANTMHVDVEDTAEGKTTLHPFEYKLAD